MGLAGRLDHHIEDSLEFTERKKDNIMIKWKKIISLLLLLTLSIITNAQDKNNGTDNLMRSNGRIYVVVAVILVILIGLILYIVRLDRKISKLEKQQ